MVDVTEFAPIVGIDPGVFSRGYGTVSYGGDKGNYVRFFTKAVYLSFLSNDQGRPVYEGREYIEICSPGGKSVLHREATEVDRKKYVDEYAQFKAGNEKAVTGTPIETWPRLGVDQVEMLKHLKIYSVDQLADIPDSALHRLGLGGLELRAQAKVFLEAAKGAAPFQKLAAENALLKEEIELLKEQFRAIANEKFEEIQKKKTQSDDKAVDQKVEVIHEELPKIAYKEIPEMVRRKRGRPKKTQG